MTQLAEMTLEQLRDAQQQIMVLRKANEEARQFAGTAIGRRTIEQDTADLDAFRSSYAAIDTEGPAEQVVRALIRMQVADTLLTKALKKLTEHKAIAKSLDSDLEKVNNTIMVREDAETKGRRT